MVDLPAPELPTRAIVVPGDISRLKSRRILLLALIG